MPKDPNFPVCCKEAPFEQQGGHHPQVEADGAQDRLSHHGKCVLETAVAVDNGAEN